MSRHNHSAILSRYDYDEPVEPTRAIRRLTGRSRKRPKPNDQKDLSDYKKAIQTWNASCSTVLGSLLNVFTSDVIGRLEATDLNLTNATKRNINNIINWINTKFSGWSDARGTRNYDEMKSIGNFTTIVNTNEGFKNLKLLTD